MADASDRGFLLGIFLMEAWDSAGTLEEGLARLADPAGPAAEPLIVVTHRLKGSAALHGFAGVSELAAVAEEILEGAAAAPLAERAAAAAFLEDLAAVLKDVFDGISATGREDADRIAAFKARHAARFPPGPEGPGTAPAPPAAHGEAEGPAPSPAAGAAYRLVQEVDRFFAESTDVLGYFGPEAAEHLEVMTQSLLALERRGWDEEELNRLFRATHTLKGAAYTVGCGPVGDVAHLIEDLLAAVREARLAFTPAVVEGALAGVDALKLVLHGAAGARPDLGEALERGLAALRALVPAVPPPAEPPAPEPATVPGEPAAPAGLEPLPPVAVPPTPEILERLAALPRPAPGARPGRGPATVGGSIRVNLERLDSLMNLVGELMIARSRLERRLEQLERVGELLLFSRSRMTHAVRDFETKYHDPRLAGPWGPAGGAEAGSGGAADLFAELEFDRYDDFNILARRVAELSADIAEVQSQHASLIRAIREDIGQIQRLTAALRKEVTRARMVPIGRLFARFTRQVREAARAAGRSVALEVRGEATEVDNTVMEQIADPLLHLVQNAIAHGIEPAEDRLARGKPAQGTVWLRASHQGAFLHVEVEDDGRGMDAERLRQEAVERGLLGPAEARALSPAEALNLIFLPGFSTAPEVTRASGRGVGLDVVRTNVSRLNGEVDVTTEVGQRTRFTLKLPLTVAIADALLVRVGTEMLAFPFMAVASMRVVRCGEVQAAGDRETVRPDGQPLELVRLDRVLGLPAAGGERVPIVVLRGGGHPFAVAVDELLGKEEMVIKRLHGLLEGVGVFSGATISAEGRVILLVDPTRLLEAGRGAPPLGEAPGAGVGEARAPSHGARQVLLVDDSISVRKFVGQMLEKAGFRVFTAVDGQDALQQLTEITVDAVITDLEMPRVNGYALIEDLKRRRATRGVPVVVLTTRAGEKHASLARRLGVRHYVTKPVEEEAFVRLMEAVTAGVAEPALSVAAGCRETWG